MKLWWAKLLFLSLPTQKTALVDFFTRHLLNRRPPLLAGFILLYFLLNLTRRRLMQVRTIQIWFGWFKVVTLRSPGLLPVLQRFLILVKVGCKQIDFSVVCLLLSAELGVKADERHFVFLRLVNNLVLEFLLLLFRRRHPIYHEAQRVVIGGQAAACDCLVGIMVARRARLCHRLETGNRWLDWSSGLSWVLLLHTQFPLLNDFDFLFARQLMRVNLNRSVGFE